LLKLSIVLILDHHYYYKPSKDEIKIL